MLGGHGPESWIEAVRSKGKPIPKPIYHPLIYDENLPQKWTYFAMEE